MNPLKKGNWAAGGGSCTRKGGDYEGGREGGGGWGSRGGRIGEEGYEGFMEGKWVTKLCITPHLCTADLFWSVLKDTC